MSRPFVITAATNSVFLDDHRQARAEVTVSNASGRELRGRAVLTADDPQVESWLQIDGNAERSFPIAGTKKYAIDVQVPVDVPTGNYSFRLDMVGEEQPDEQYVRGPELMFEVPELESAGMTRSDFPWAVVLGVAALLLIGGGYLTYQLLSPDTTAHEEPGIWARGTACLTPGRSFDLDRGVLEGGTGDLFYQHEGGFERYLRPWRGGSRMAEGGTAPLGQVSFAELTAANFSRDRFDASYEDPEVRSGTTWFVRTSEERYAKLHILREGQFMRFEWITYAKEDDRGRLSASPINNGICTIEEELNCGNGQRPGDAIEGFRLVHKEDRSALLEIDLSYDADHGEVAVGARLVDERGETISGAWRPTSAEQGTNRVPVLFRRAGFVESAEVLIFMLEHGPSDPFVCRRFPFARQWGVP